MPARIRRPYRSTLAPARALALAVFALAAGSAGTSTAYASPAAPAIDPNASASTPLTFDAHGYAEVRTGIRGRVAIDGTFSGQLDRATNTYSGSFSLTPTVAKITVLGLLPATAETDWIFDGPVTGALRDGKLTMRAAVRIRHPHLYVGGIPIAGGGRCATRTASVIELETAPATTVRDIADGGTLSTTGRGFTISPLSGCGWLDGLLSAVAAGSGNQAAITLSRPAA